MARDRRAGGARTRRLRYQCLQHLAHRRPHQRTAIASQHGTARRARGAPDLRRRWSTRRCGGAGRPGGHRGSGRSDRGKRVEGVLHQRDAEPLDRARNSQPGRCHLGSDAGYQNCRLRPVGRDVAWGRACAVARARQDHCRSLFDRLARHPAPRGVSGLHRHNNSYSGCIRDRLCHSLRIALHRARAAVSDLELDIGPFGAGHGCPIAGAADPSGIPRALIGQEGTGRISTGGLRQRIPAGSRADIRPGAWP